MKRLFCLVLPLFLLSGCAQSYRIENQAHAISMGIDWHNGSMIVSVQAPNLGAPAGKKGESESSSYQIYSARAENFETAYNILQSTLPQQLNLTHLKTIVFSEEFARSDQFIRTIETFMDVFLVTGSASVIVTEKTAQTLIENQKPHIGIRLSITIPSMLSYHADNGYIPITTLSALYTGLKGRYSTVLCPLADTATDSDIKNDPFMPGSIPREGDNKNEYMGACVFDREKMVGILNGYEMQLCYFLMGESNRIADFASPFAMRVSTRKKRDVKMEITQDQVNIRITLYLDIATLEDGADLSAIEKRLVIDFEKVMDKCKDMSVEPFGFARCAARQFKDNRAFEDFDWLQKFKEANVEIRLRVNGES
ncbi:MAG: hypothetical protein IKJ65_09240 [Clostridia bacterium]|nr:hypothetical protein [Clostridia bacterium]